jgi:6-phosphofructokinase 1
MVVEVMGRHAGWIATYAGIAGGATVILVPELPFDIDEVCTILQHRHRRGRYASIVVVAEGAEPREETMKRLERPLDRYGHPKLGGIAHVLPAIEADRLRHEVVALGHVQRGGAGRL